ncbi:hypothetical protein [Erythrobacter sp. EC-HK427]|uniref:hypothetical protein n=1 Tax=Erythrobacter sp. EC-HK427 TaxID=2038396 RepID=UPI00125AF68A|nr:hypothetical protein [Erythrobacter sp. EC-HK427]VVT17748.1 membrane hypothetical protein [Erythrobacter sp. EC-HK427]
MTSLVASPARHATVFVTLAFLLLFIIDIFVWQSHPFGILGGKAAGSALDPFLLLSALLIGGLLGSDWRSLVAAGFAAAGLEWLTVMRGTREFFGRENDFQLESVLAKLLAICFIISLVAMLKYVARMNAKPEPEQTREEQ